MPAPKRQHKPSSTIPDPPVKRENKSTDKTIKKRLIECSKEQQNHIEKLETSLKIWADRYGRLKDHVTLQNKKDEERLAVNESIEEHMKKYRGDIARFTGQEVLVKLSVKEMKDEEEKLDKVYQEIAEYKNYERWKSHELVKDEPNPYVPYERKLKNALKQMPATTRNASEMKNLPKLHKKDLDKMDWPEVSRDWSYYSRYWEREFDEAVECRKLNKKVKSLEREVEQAKSECDVVQSRIHCVRLYDENRNSKEHDEKIKRIERLPVSDRLEQLIRAVFEKKASLEKLKKEQKDLEEYRNQREDLLKKLQEEMNTNSLKCSICLEPLTNGEQSERCPQLFGNCGHTACATCMPNFKGQVYPNYWNCPECRAPSDRILTNWALMQLIKEIPGQPNRVVRAPPAPAPPVVLRPAPPPLALWQAPNIAFPALDVNWQEIDEAVRRIEIMAQRLRQDVQNP